MLTGPHYAGFGASPGLCFALELHSFRLKSLLQKSEGSPDPPNRQSEALEMTEIWPPEGATAHFLAVSMCRVTLDTAVDTFATGS